MAAKKKTEPENTEPPQPPEAGDVVQLNSGGPSMTISNITGDGASAAAAQATTIWFDDDGKLQSGTFPLVSLCLAEEE